METNPEVKPEVTPKVKLKVGETILISPLFESTDFAVLKENYKITTLFSRGSLTNPVGIIPKNSIVKILSTYFLSTYYSNSTNDSGYEYLVSFLPSEEKLHEISQELVERAARDELLPLEEEAIQFDIPENCLNRIQSQDHSRND